MSTMTTASIAAQNTFSDAVRVGKYFNLSISGTFSATVTAQRSYDGGTTWYDVDNWTAPSEEVGYEPEFVWYRSGVKTGAYTSGTVVIRIGRSDPELTRN